MKEPIHFLPPGWPATRCNIILSEVEESGQSIELTRQKDHATCKECLQAMKDKP